MALAGRMHTVSLAPSSALSHCGADAHSTLQHCRGCLITCRVVITTKTEAWVLRTLIQQ